ncbi:DUF2058 family protein [Luteimonas sp. RD2P54]|uniref:DUF2058 family protein n=1 Tax=Luteimonas endophytica TaxID=3042023 RepID=A0ABT6J8P4_9GAMM|nr:DUF2058 family protein [Luteimonas endophytica]MDH5823191.1 DUF2058 family protein [Luteimonas endophytica]
MSDSLRDQLLGLGFKAPAPQPKKPPRDRQPGAKPPRSAEQRRPPGKRPPARAEAPGGGRRGGRGRDEIDLAKAYAIRAQKEKEERIEAERRRQEEARQRREARARLATLLQGRALNAEEADIARHFEYGGKIKRIYVTADQLTALNAGELGVVQLNGRYLLVEAAVLAEAEAVFAPAVALKVDPAASAADDPYADPRYQVPDDLVW